MIFIFSKLPETQSSGLLNHHVLPLHFFPYIFPALLIQEDFFLASIFISSASPLYPTFIPFFSSWPCLLQDNLKCKSILGLWSNCSSLLRVKCESWSCCHISLYGNNISFQFLHNLPGESLIKSHEVPCSGSFGLGTEGRALSSYNSNPLWQVQCRIH